MQSPFVSAKKTFRFRRLLFAGGAAALLTLSGCRTAPDLRPFADATSQLASSIKTTGKTVVSEVDTMSAGWEKSERATAMLTVNKFEKQWVQRNALADALLDYSASLTAIAQAGEQGEQSAQAVAASFKKLTDAVDVALPQAEAVAEAVKIGSYLYGKFAQDHAAKTLGESMRRLQPTIDETATVLGKSLQQVETGLDAVRAQNAQNFEDEIVLGEKVSTARNTLKTLSLRRAALLDMLNADAKARDDLRAGLLKAADADKEKEFARLSGLNADIAAELAAVEGAFKSESEKLAPFDARKAADASRLATEMELVRAIRAGLDDWAAAHARLAAAALEKKPLQVDDLVQTALEIRDLAKTVRAGHNP